MRFQPRFDGYVERVHQALRDQPFISSVLGAHATLVEAGHVVIEMPLRADLLQPQGQVHGTVATALADSAAGYAAETLVAIDQHIVTVEYKVNFLAPGVGERLRASGRVLRAGRTLSVCEADVYAEGEGEGRHILHMVTTMMAVGA
ncbi:MAG: PaaI family thioesterase [Gammaproteobacteria bacterium]|nr:PaaI family thioesterase [Gammaproteobacteria bacterium]MCP5198466.1 PaaI family thioesterase [Gammaproteobacteria bacterium]